jgi:hypothetical protein
MRAATLLLAVLLACATAQACYESGERGQGAPGFPAWPYKPCCDGSEQVLRPDLGYGKWCVGGSTGGSTPAKMPSGGGSQAPKPPVDCDVKVHQRDACKALIAQLSTIDGALDGFTFCSVAALEAEVQACAKK